MYCVRKHFRYAITRIVDPFEQILGQFAKSNIALPRPMNRGSSCRRYVARRTNASSTLTPRASSSFASSGSGARAFRILVLPGDHVGPEIMREAIKVLDVVQANSQGKTRFEYSWGLVGGSSIDRHGTPITDEVLKIAKDESDAVLLGSVGGPEWGTKQPSPESGILSLRQHLDAFANVRPCRFYSRSVVSLSPLKSSIVQGTNFIILRENCGGAYFGDKVETADFASDAWQYQRHEIERCARVAAALATNLAMDSHTSNAENAKAHAQLVTATVWSADKANVLASSRLWRQTMTDIFAREFPHVELKHQLADSMSMLMMKQPSMFNGVILTDNTFGDLLSDQAGGIVGTLGLCPSASLCGVPGPVPDGNRCNNGIYEPAHGSAPDIAGKSIVNPMAQILSAAMMLRYSFAMRAEAAAIESAVEKVIDSKEIGGLEVRSPDLGGQATTREVGDAISETLDQLLKRQRQRSPMP